MTPTGWLIHYADGSTFSSKDGAWEKAHAHGIQVVVVYFAETYPCWHGDVLMAHNYKDVIHGALRQIDYYWMTPEGAITGGSAEEVPSGIHVKQGSTSDKFFTILNLAQQEETWDTP